MIIDLPLLSHDMSPSDEHSQVETSMQRDSESSLRQYKKQRKTKNISLVDVSHQLMKRKMRYNQCSTISDIMCFVGMFGIILMIIENEIIFSTSGSNYFEIVLILKLIITISSVLLIVLAFVYHYYELDLYCINNSIDDWRVGLTLIQAVMIVLEVIICAIHPFPQQFSVTRHAHNGSEMLSTSTVGTEETDKKLLSYIHIDVALGLPMFCRLYLLARVVLFHSRVIHDTTSRSLGYLNRVSIDFIFVIKYYLEIWPMRSLMIFSSIFFFIGSWSFRACEYQPGENHISFQNAMWLCIVTFTTVGYGDFSPSTYCGRSVAALIAFVGLVTSALLIAVLSSKLEFSRSEKYVHEFVLNTELNKANKCAAANIIKCAVGLFRLKQHGRHSSFEHLRMQRKLFTWIKTNQRIKQELRNLMDTCVEGREASYNQDRTNTIHNETVQHLVFIQEKIDQLEEKLVKIDNTMESIQNLMNIMLTKDIQ
ncbi:unnamed protein product [Rotaria socialis]|uniref:Calmodulin-binding domain-containing protein n=1 Tax=Rotaria socialis TaxID=392032 RepID=A0A820UT31_9BILA|nr:unnamed protein product [Rotaria socialis]